MTFRSNQMYSSTESAARRTRARRERRAAASRASPPRPHPPHRPRPVSVRGRVDGLDRGRDRERPCRSVFAANPAWLNGTKPSPCDTCSVTRAGSSSSPAAVFSRTSAPSATPAVATSLRIDLHERPVGEGRLQLVGALRQPALVHEQWVREQQELAVPDAVAAPGCRDDGADHPAGRGACPSPRGARPASRTPGRRRTRARGSAKIPSPGRDIRAGRERAGGAGLDPPTWSRAPPSRGRPLPAGTHRRSGRGSRARAIGQPCAARSPGPGGRAPRPG